MQFTESNNGYLSETKDLEKNLRSEYDFNAIIGHDPKLVELLDIVVKIKNADLPVLLEGESGTGKELIAQALHFNSKRNEFPLLNVNCGAIPENLMETEFFGYEKGAFTGAISRKTGKFEAAGKGTIFLDEIDGLNLNLQVKLLRVIQWGEFTPVGGVKPRKAEARIIAASNSNLGKLVQEGKFRHDLFYRLNVLRLELPPLRERKPDIPVLCQYFLKLHGPRLGFAEVRISDDALRRLSDYDFPGNVRELESLIIRAILLASGETIQPCHLSSGIQPQNSNGHLCSEMSSQSSNAHLRNGIGAQGANGLLAETIWDWPFAKAKNMLVRDFEKQYLIHQLKIHHGVVLQAARAASMYEANFRRKMKKYSINSAGEAARNAAGAQAQKLE